MSKKQESLVSVIIPVYNLEDYIEHTLNSVLRQTIKNISVIVVNDGSTDSTLRIIQRYALKDTRIRIIDKKNGGVSSARNRGLSQVRSKYFTFVDGDDVITDHCIERLVSLAELHQADMVSSLVMAASDAHEAKEYISDDVRVMDSNDAILELLYDGRIKNHSCAKLFRTDRLGKLRFDNQLTIGEDMELVFRSILLSRVVVVSSDVLYSYLRRAQSAMNSSFSIKRADSYLAAKKIVATRLGGAARRAARTKLFTEALSILSKAHSRRANNIDIYGECYSVVASLSGEVAGNDRARKRQRIYAGLARMSPIFAVYAINTKARLERIIRFFHKTMKGKK